MDGLTVEVEDPRRGHAVATLLRQSDAVAARLYPGEFRRPITPEALAKPGTLVFVARRMVDRAAVGCCALFERGDGTAELKRMIVDEAARGGGAGSALLLAAEAEAWRRGVRTMLLEVGVRNVEARALYRRAGYQSCGPFAPYEASPVSLFMQRRLPGAVEVETARLLLRRPTLADVPALFAFLGDAGAMRHTHADVTLRDCRRRIAVHERRRRRDGFAPWTVMRREDGEIIGWGGLYEDPFEPGWGVEVGYWFHPSAWGQGYAGEVVAACTSLADGPLALPEVRAFAHPDNAASRRVLERAGFAEEQWVPEMERLLFRRTRQN